MNRWSKSFSSQGFKLNTNQSSLWLSLSQQDSRGGVPGSASKEGGLRGPPCLRS